MSTAAETKDEIKFICRICGQHMAVPPEAAGIEVECPGCRVLVEVPWPSRTPVPPPSPAPKPYQVTSVTVLSELPPAREPRADIDFRDRAEMFHIAMWVSAGMAGVMLIAALLKAVEDDKLWWAYVVAAGSFLTLGFWCWVVSQILHVRADTSELLRKGLPAK